MKLTKNAERVLVAAARMTGDPREPFTAAELERYHNLYELDHDSHPRVHEQGLKTFSLPALIRRSYAIKFDNPTGPVYCLTDDGFEQALLISGGRGLL